MSLLKHRLQLHLQLLPGPHSYSTLGYNPNTTTTAVSTPIFRQVFSLFDFEKVCVLGHGNQGIVYKVRHKHTSAIYALKIIPTQSQTTHPYQPSIEANILCRTDSPFIIKCHAIFEPPTLAGSKAILMDYMDAGTLDSLLKINGPFSESSIAQIAYQILNGLQYLHARNIVHLDIKPSNLLVDKKLKVKIADFGVSKIVNAHSTPENYGSYVGTYAYMSPERMDSSRYDPKYVYAGDVWSLGVSLLELYMGHFPFFPPEKKPSWMEVALVTCFGEPIISIPETASAEFLSFIKCCLEKDPSKRWAVPKLLSHPFVYRVRDDFN
ncbi:mitogen-activated protein kinase kinase 9-like [Mangifera indica]|uniref:mitogen-activated protein kinase kinase 9-like n=1 Tax=Mangifera indica TaxID=29780 RepID=UPI001CF94E67|nr:mitogen-activated protein kinase kinase 9-like [Mangifera indica]